MQRSSFVVFMFFILCLTVFAVLFSRLEPNTQAQLKPAAQQSCTDLDWSSQDEMVEGPDSVIFRGLLGTECRNDSTSTGGSHIVFVIFFRKGKEVTITVRDPQDKPVMLSASERADLVSHVTAAVAQKRFDMPQELRTQFVSALVDYLGKDK